MSGKLFIHVGAGKTGTSALQAFFAANREALAKQGCVFPEPGRVCVNSGVQHHPLAALGPDRNPDVIDLWAEIGRFEAPVQIVSSENFHSKIEEAEGIEFFQSVKAVLGEKDIRIVFYFRRQIQWLQSAWSQWVKGDLQRRTFSDFVEKYKKSQIGQIHKFASVFGVENVIIRPFEREQFEGGTIQRDFVALAGLRWDEGFVVPKGNPNPRLAPDALELKRQINKLAESRGELQVLIRDLLQYSAKASADSDTIFHSHGLMDRAEQIAYERALEPRYSEIARTFLGREDGILFRDGFCDEAPADPLVSGEDAPLSTEQATAFLILQLYRRTEAQRRRIKALEDRLDE